MPLPPRTTLRLISNNLRTPESELSPNTRNKILGARLGSFSYGAIATYLNLPKSTIHIQFSKLNAANPPRIYKFPYLDQVDQVLLSPEMFAEFYGRYIHHQKYHILISLST